MLVQRYGEPFADSSALPTYYVSRLSRQHVTVALTGDGGDESFSGYDHYRQVMQWQVFDRVPLRVRRPLSRGMRRILALLPYGNLTSRLARGLYMAGSELPDRYRLHMTLLKPEEKQACFTKHFCNLAQVTSNLNGFVAEVPWARGMDGWDWMMRHDQQYYLPECLMVKTDRASMANGLEVRCPFLDYRLVEHAARIPSSLKRNQSSGKVILKRIAQRLLPREVLEKPKTGFTIPLAQWFRKKDLKDMLAGTLLDDRSSKRGLFQAEFLKRMIEEQFTGRRNWFNRLWAFLCLELWFREFID